MGMERTRQEIVFKTECSEFTDWICGERTGYAGKGRGQNQR